MVKYNRWNWYVTSETDLVGTWNNDTIRGAPTVRYFNATVTVGVRGEPWSVQLFTGDLNQARLNHFTELSKIYRVPLLISSERDELMAILGDGFYIPIGPWGSGLEVIDSTPKMIDHPVQESYWHGLGALFA